MGQISNKKLFSRFYTIDRECRPTSIFSLCLEFDVSINPKMSHLQKGFGLFAVADGLSKALKN